MHEQWLATAFPIPIPIPLSACEPTTSSSNLGGADGDGAAAEQAEARDKKEVPGRSEAEEMDEGDGCVVGVGRQSDAGQRAAAAADNGCRQVGGGKCRRAAAGQPPAKPWNGQQRTPAAIHQPINGLPPTRMLRGRRQAHHAKLAACSAHQSPQTTPTGLRRQGAGGACGPPSAHQAQAAPPPPRPLPSIPQPRAAPC